MQNALNAVSRYVVKVARTVGRDWNAFWYTPADPDVAGLCSHLDGADAGLHPCRLGTGLERLFRPDELAVAGPGAIDRGRPVHFFVLVLGAGAVDVAGLRAVDGDLRAASRSGLWTRVTSVLSLFTAISYTNRVPAALFGLDQINIMLTLYLAIGPSGQALSLDRWLLTAAAGRKRPARPQPRAPTWPSGLIQVHMCVIYLFAGHLEAARAVVVERRGDVAGVRQSRVPVARHDLAGVAPVARQLDEPRFGRLGDRRSVC